MIRPFRPQQTTNEAAAALELESEALAAPLPPLLAHAERLAATAGLGVHGRRSAGMGETFWQFRRYDQGDASNTIDWRQSAKSQHVFVREREWEAVQAVWFWCDGSDSMRFASHRNLVTKFERAGLLALALACLLVRGGEHVGIPGEHAPSGGRAALHRIARRLTSGGRSAEMPQLLSAMKPAPLVWFGDFLSPMSEIERLVRNLAGKGFSGHLIQIIDPAEQDFPYSGRTRFEWNPTGRTETLGRAESARAQYRRRFDAQAAALRTIAARLGWTCLAHRTDQRPETALVALYANLGGAPAQGALGM